MKSSLMILLAAATAASSALADDGAFAALYTFQAPAPNTFTSPLGSQPDTRPALGPGNTVWGMTSDGGENGNGVIFLFNLLSHQYTLLHTFSALDASGDNPDGADPGSALTRGPGDIFYGMAQSGGANGNGTIFKITASGEFTVLHTFSALDANGNNYDGAAPKRAIVIGSDGYLYGTTRLGGENTCTPNPVGCGVAWSMDTSGNHFTVVHQFAPSEGHAASLIQASDGLFYGCAVWPGTSMSGTPLPSGTLFRMAPSGQNFEVLYTFGQTDADGDNTDGADPYEPLLETAPGVFYGSAKLGGANGNGVVFRYSLSNPSAVEVLHQFSATVSGYNADGANPYARLTLGPEGWLYSTASSGGLNGNGVVYGIGEDGEFAVLHTFSATDPTTGANPDGATPDFGVVFDWDNSALIGIADYGGNGSTAGFSNSGGTLYSLQLRR